MKKAVYILLVVLFLAGATIANERVEIRNVSSPQFVMSGEIFTLSAKVEKPIFASTIELYLHTDFDVALKSVELSSLSIKKQIRFYRVDIQTELEKVYKIEAGNLENIEDELFQINFDLSSSGDDEIEIYLTTAENYYEENEKSEQRRSIKIYDKTTYSGKSLQLENNSEVRFEFSTKEYELENILIEFWAKLNDGQSKFLQFVNEAGDELTNLSVTEFGYLTIPDLLDAEFFDELYVDQNNWNYFLIELNKVSGRLSVYINDDLFYRGICSNLQNRDKLELRLINSTEQNESFFDRLKIWAFDNNEKLALLNKNFNSYTADSSSVILQYNFDADNSIFEIEHVGRVSLEKSTAPIFSRAPQLNVVLFGQSYNLSWQVNELSNAKKFVVEKSYDGINFTEATTVLVVDESKTLYNVSDRDYSDNQIIYYRIKQVNEDNTEIYSSNVKVGRGQVKHFKMQQNYPNPFNPITTVTVEVKQADEFEVIVYDIVGKTVEILHKGPLAAGLHRFSFDGTDLPSGLYLCEVKSRDELEVMKMILAK